MARATAPAFSAGAGTHAVAATILVCLFFYGAQPLPCFSLHCFSKSFGLMPNYLKNSLLKYDGDDMPTI